MSPKRSRAHPDFKTMFPSRPIVGPRLRAVNEGARGFGGGGDIRNRLPGCMRPRSAGLVAGVEA